VLHVARDLPVTITLKNILQKCFPEEYASREQEEAEQAAAAAQRLPLFVMTGARWPGADTCCRADMAGVQAL
jgi:DTW domain-containing protein YfiP